MITLIACMEMNNGIGNDENDLLFDFPKDKKHFNYMTSGKIVVMGRKTWESLPKRPLPKRKNYILTRDESFKAKEGAKVIHSIDEVLELSKTFDVFVIGGGEIYEQLLPYADRLVLTHVHVVDGRARVFFPDYDYKEWKIQPNLIQKHEADEKHEHDFTFATYHRIRKEDKE
jgi:dihydrofolate reductase